ncbi:MAG: glycosyltransferase family 4 protein [Thermoguttaceae bacterium]
MQGWRKGASRGATGPPVFGAIPTDRARVVFDTPPGNSGPARYVAAIARALDPSEFEVLLLDPAPGTGPADAQKQPEKGGVGSPALDGADGAPAGHRLIRACKRAVPPLAKAWMGFAREARRAARRIREAEPVDLFHTQNTGCEEMPVAARLARIPSVLGTFHVDSTCDLEGARSGFTYRALEWISNRCLHRAIAVSEATRRDWIARTGIPEHRVVTIHNGIDPERFCRKTSAGEARRRLGLPEDGQAVAGVGRLNAAKGFAYLIEALALLRQEFPKANVVLAGSGPLREKLESRAAALGLADRVVFLGQCADVDPVFDAADVFVLPSLSEALGFALLEAMAHELPAVGTRVGGVPEVLVPEETGFLVPPRDAAALAAALRPLLSSAELRSRMGQAGHQRVLQHFREDEMVRKTIDIYRQMLHNSRPCGGDRPRSIHGVGRSGGCR